MRQEANDNSVPYTIPTDPTDPSYISLTLTWPTGTIVDVEIIVKDIPGGKIAVFDHLEQEPPLFPNVDYLYVFRIVSGGNILAPHDQSFPIFHLFGTPQSVEAGFKNQAQANRANTVAV